MTRDKAMPGKRGEPSRFFEKVSYPDGGDGCMIWTGARSHNGYGRFWSERGMMFAHRWAYGHCVKPIPPGLHLDHLCRNRACVNPDHLEPTTNRENILRGESFSAQNAAKTHCPAGHSYSNDNMRRDPRSGRRLCRECERLASARWREKRGSLS